jgi:hypothetical protein
VTAAKETERALPKRPSPPADGFPEAPERMAQYEGRPSKNLRGYFERYSELSHDCMGAILRTAALGISLHRHGIFQANEKNEIEKPFEIHLSTAGREEEAVM